MIQRALLVGGKDAHTQAGTSTAKMVDNLRWHGVLVVRQWQHKKGSRKWPRECDVLVIVAENVSHGLIDEARSAAPKGIPVLTLSHRRSVMMQQLQHAGYPRLSKPVTPPKPEKEPAMPPITPKPLAWHEIVRGKRLSAWPPEQVNRLIREVTPVRARNGGGLSHGTQEALVRRVLAVCPTTTWQEVRLAVLVPAAALARLKTPTKDSPFYAARKRMGLTVRGGQVLHAGAEYVNACRSMSIRPLGMGEITAIPAPRAVAPVVPKPTPTPRPVVVAPEPVPVPVPPVPPVPAPAPPASPTPYTDALIALHAAMQSAGILRVEVMADGTVNYDRRVTVTREITL